MEYVDFSQKAYEFMDKSLIERIFFKLDTNNEIVVAAWPFVLLAFIAFIVINNFIEGESEGSSNFFDDIGSTLWGIIILSVLAIVTYKLLPDATPRKIEMTDRMNKKVAEMQYASVLNEYNPIKKAKLISEYSDSNGRIYYLKDHRHGSAGYEDEYGLVLHYYVSPNLQKQFLEAVKNAEESYKNGKEKTSFTAENLAELFSTGNYFMKKNKEKAMYYSSEAERIRKTAKKAEQIKLEEHNKKIKANTTMTPASI